MISDKKLEDYFGRNISYSKEKLSTYNNLRNDALSPLKGKTMADIFVYAAVFGYINSKKIKLEDIIPQISTNALSNKQKSVLLTIAISHTNSLEILFNPEQAIEIIQEFANGGMEILESELLENVHVDTIPKLSSMMKDIIAERLNKENVSKIEDEV